jgi:hypothetical protein
MMLNSGVADFHFMNDVDVMRIMKTHGWRWPPTRASPIPRQPAYASALRRQHRACWGLRADRNVIPLRGGGAQDDFAAGRVFGFGPRRRARGRSPIRVVDPAVKDGATYANPQATRAASRTCW